MKRRRCQLCRAGRNVGLPLCIRHLEIITLDEYRIQTGWLTPAQVMAMKARGEFSTNANT